jgi:hypothetical protein
MFTQFLSLETPVLELPRCREGTSKRFCKICLRGALGESLGDSSAAFALRGLKGISISAALGSRIVLFLQTDRDEYSVHPGRATGITNLVLTRYLQISWN